MLQYKIPQNIGIEDKIVGPFSLRQLIILAIGGGISYALFTVASRIYELNVIEYFVIALPAVFALMAAMIKIHNVSFTKFVLLTLEFAIKPKKRMWDHHGIAAMTDPDLTDKTRSKKTKAVTEMEEKKDVNLSDLSSVLDSGGFEHVEKIQHEDIDQAEDDDLITEAYFGHKKDESKTENMYWRTKDMQKKKLDLLAKMSPAPAPAPAPTPTPTPSPTATAEKKESVAENLANVIKEARANNQAKKKRPRKRKPKVAQPIRQNTQINTTVKSAPKLIQKTPKEGEASLRDLKEGGEIEINLN